MSSVGWNEWVTVWTGAREGVKTNGAVLPGVTVLSETRREKG
jgi:hypothetical protein